MEQPGGRLRAKLAIDRVPHDVHIRDEVVPCMPVGAMQRVVAVIAEIEEDDFVALAQRSPERKVAIDREPVAVAEHQARRAGIAVLANVNGRAVVHLHIEGVTRARHMMNRRCMFVFAHLFTAQSIRTGSISIARYMSSRSRRRPDFGAHRGERGAQRFQFSRFYHHLPSVALLDSLDRRGRGSEHAESFRRRVLRQRFRERPRPMRADELRLLALDPHHREARKRRIHKLAAQFQFAAHEARVILIAGGADAVMMRRVGLDDHAARALAASRASRDLGQQLERSLGGAEVGQVQRHVGEDDRGQRDAGKIETLGDHLRADQNIDLAGAKLGQDSARARRAPLVSLSIRSMRAAGIISASACLSRSVPKPWPLRP